MNLKLWGRLILALSNVTGLAVEHKPKCMPSGKIEVRRNSILYVWRSYRHYQSRCKSKDSLSRNLLHMQVLIFQVHVSSGWGSVILHPKDPKRLITRFLPIQQTFYLNRLNRGIPISLPTSESQAPRCLIPSPQATHTTCFWYNSVICICGGFPRPGAVTK